MTIGRALDHLALAGLILYSAAAGISIAASQIGFGLAFAAWAVQVARRERPLPRTGLEPLFLAYVLAEILSFAFSQNHAQNLVYMRRLLLIPMVWLVADRVRALRDLDLLMVPLIGVTDALAVTGIVQYLRSGGGLEHRVRLMQHVLTTSGLFMMVGFLCLGLLITARTRVRRLALGVSLISIATCLLFTYSRSAWLGTLAAIPIVLAFWKPRVLIAIPVGALVAWLVLPSAMRERLASAFDPAHPNNVERVNMWKAGVRIVRDHPWTGVGDIGLGEIYERYRSPTAREKVSHLHDNVIMLAVTLGIPGAFAVLALFARILWVLASNVRALEPARGPPWGVALGALAGAVAFLVMGLFEWNFGDAEAAMMFWYVIGSSIAAARMGRASSAEHRERAARGGPAAFYLIDQTRRS